MGTIHESLKPHRPLDPGDRSYVLREDGAARIVDALGTAPLVGVVGPVGVGKSTELAAVVSLLRHQGRPAFHVPLDRHNNMRALSVASMQAALASALRGGPRDTTTTSVHDELLIAVRDAGRPVLAVDGLEKVVDPERGRELLDALGELAPSADVVAVLPWYAAYGPGAGRVMGDHERVVALRPVEPARARGFLGQMLALRNPFLAILEYVDESVRLSGGVPRTFLQLVADTSVYGWGASGLTRAVREQQESIRRALLPGDAAAIKAATGTDGREIELDRRIRLLASGLLLERAAEGAVVVQPHPLLQGLL